MNKQLLSITLFLLIYGLSFAQSRKLKGSSDANSISFLSTLNSQFPRVHSENKQRMQIGAGENVVMAAAQRNFANTALSNLIRTSINKSLMPKAGSTLSLGGAGRAWQDLYLNGVVYLGSDAFLSGPQDNTFTGRQAGMNNTGSGNTAYGFQALLSNTDGTNNTALGYGSLVNNTNGGSNTSVGYQTLYSNTGGFGNTAMGRLAIGFSTKDYNTGIGYASGDIAVNYSNATFLGAYATTADDLANVTAVGYGAQTTASNTVMLGNASVVSVITAGNFVSTSDGRFKSNIKEEVPGLEFINKLRPVTYHYNIHKLNSYIRQESNMVQKNGIVPKSDEQATAAAKVKEEESIRAKEAINYSGFVAQEVEAAARKVNYDFSGVYKPANNKDVYGLSYGEFVVPLVKAVQELSKMNDAKDTKINDLQKQIDELKAMVLAGSTKNTSIKTAASTVSTGASLQQNVPNPFAHATVITYTLPQSRIGRTSAQIIITDKSGNILKQVNLEGSGKGVLSVDASTLASGAYYYSLYVDRNLVESRQMILAK